MGAQLTKPRAASFSVSSYCSYDRSQTSSSFNSLDEDSSLFTDPSSFDEELLMARRLSAVEPAVEPAVASAVVERDLMSLAQKTSIIVAPTISITKADSLQVDDADLSER